MIRKHRSRLGQSLTEFSLVLPIVALLLLGAIDLGRVFYTKLALANASRTAAIFAINYNELSKYNFDSVAATNAIKQTAVREASPQITLTTADVSVATNWQPGSVYTVTVSTTWYAVTPMINAFWGGGGLQLAHSTQLRHNCNALSPCDSYP